jgi:hypothetical protein
MYNNAGTIKKLNVVIEVGIEEGFFVERAVRIIDIISFR